MFFIGIISNKNEVNFIKELTKSIDNITVVEINENSIDNVKNIKFNTILIKENSNILKYKIEQIKNILKTTKYIVINSDIEIDLKVLMNTSIRVITYGFNSKSTITTSSITDEDVLVCLQRNITNIEGNIIEPQEILKSNIEKMDVLEILAIMCIEIIYKEGKF